MTQKLSCTECWLCKMVCPAYQILKEEIVSPRAKNIVESNFEKHKNAIDPNYFFKFCSGCGLCKEVCPIKLWFNAIQARTHAVESGYTSSQAEEMIENIKHHKNPFGKIGDGKGTPNKLYCC